MIKYKMKYECDTKNIWAVIERGYVNYVFIVETIIDTSFIWRRS